jgi:hypothetical protein
VVADGDVVHARADLNDLAGTLMTERSEWHTPVALIATLTKPASTSTTLALLTTSSVSSPVFRSTAARMVVPLV